MASQQVQVIVSLCVLACLKYNTSGGKSLLGGACSGSHGSPARFSRWEMEARRSTVFGLVQLRSPGMVSTLLSVQPPTFASATGLIGRFTEPWMVSESIQLVVQEQFIHV